MPPARTTPHGATSPRHERSYSASPTGSPILPTGRASNHTSNAIVSRSLVSPRRLDGTLLGDPANIVLSEDQRTAFVMNHHGAVANPEYLQHRGRASIAVMDVRKLLDRRLDDTDSALEHDFDAGWFGGVKLLVTPGLIIASYSEG